MSPMDSVLEFVWRSRLPTTSTGRVDLQLLLPPAKHDWAEFYDFGYLDIWAEIDRRLCAEYGLLYFDHMELARRCPGVRCDGMHFGSRFTQFQCHSSKHLLDRLLIGFAKKHLI